ncbi:MAG: 3-deoxy-8-phosphooctulonate synthase [Alphaproteobacteria bacterium]|nr:MAG: 3-deoxy-8-phosphooctulonate synthase [Alphaproteobacteria bacterium]
MIRVTVGSGPRAVTFSNSSPLVVIAGPCQIESRSHAREMAEAIFTITEKLGIPFIFKSSYDKANRTSIHAQRGVGMIQGLDILAEIRADFGFPVVTDVHAPEQCKPVSEAVDLLQIPAFLCRQTDLLVAAAQTGKPIHVKKGQFLAPWDMKNVAKKIADSGNNNIILCERGITFGYNQLVVDMRALPIMAQTGYPVVMDATHAVMEPGGQGESSGGNRSFVPTIARAAVAVGVAGVFLETHNDPDSAPSDGANMVRLDGLEELLSSLKAIDALTKRISA